MKRLAWPILGFVLGLAAAALATPGVFTFSGQTSHLVPTVVDVDPAGDDVDIDWSNGNIQIVDLENADQDANTMNLPTNPVNGTPYFMRIYMDTTATRTLAWNAAFHFPGGTDIVITTTANAIDVVSCVYFSSTSDYDCTFAQDVK